MQYILIFLVIFVPLRELAALYTISYVKFVPDILVWLVFVYVLFINKFKLKLKKYDILYAGFLFVGFISTLINHTSFVAYMLQVRSITTMYILFLCLRNFKISDVTIKKVVRVLFIVSGLIVSCSFVEHFTNKCMLFPQEWTNSIIYYSNFERIYSFMNNPNVYSAYVLFVLLIGIYCNENKICNVFWGFYVLLIIGIILSASRSTLLVGLLLAICLLITVLLKKEYRKILNATLIIGLSVLLSLALNSIKNGVNLKCEKNLKFQVYMPKIVEKNKDDTSNKSNVNSKTSKNNNVDNSSNGSSKNVDNTLSVVKRINETISGTTQEKSSVNGRIYNVKKGLEIFKDHYIIGTGFGTYGSAASMMIKPSIYKTYGIEDNFYSDNDYIKILVETGIIGFSFFAAFAISLVLDALKKPYQFLVLIMFFLLGLFYNVTELQSLCLVAYLSLIIFEKEGYYE